MNVDVGHANMPASGVTGKQEGEKVVHNGSGDPGKQAPRRKQTPDTNWGKMMEREGRQPSISEVPQETSPDTSADGENTKPDVPAQDIPLTGLEEEMGIDKVDTFGPAILPKSPRKKKKSKSKGKKGGSAEAGGSDSNKEQKSGSTTPSGDDSKPNGDTDQNSSKKSKAEASGEGSPKTPKKQSKTDSKVKNKSESKSKTPNKDDPKPGSVAGKASGKKSESDGSGEGSSKSPKKQSKTNSKSKTNEQLDSKSASSDKTKKNKKDSPKKNGTAQQKDTKDSLQKEKSESQTRAAQNDLTPQSDGQTRRSKQKSKSNKRRITRMYGHYRCNLCRRFWTSAFLFCRQRGKPLDDDTLNDAMAEYVPAFKQECQDCRVLRGPFFWNFLLCLNCGETVNICECERRQRSDTDKKPHRAELCQKCQSGYLCIRGRNEEEVEIPPRTSSDERDTREAVRHDEAAEREKAADREAMVDELRSTLASMQV